MAIFGRALTWICTLLQRVSYPLVHIVTSTVDDDTPEVEALKRQLLDLRMKQATKQEFKGSEFRKIRKEVARRKAGVYVESADSGSEAAATVAMFGTTGLKGTRVMGLGCGLLLLLMCQCKYVCNQYIGYGPSIDLPTRCKWRVFAVFLLPVIHKIR